MEIHRTVPVIRARDWWYVPDDNGDIGEEAFCHVAIARKFPRFADRTDPIVLCCTKEDPQSSYAVNGICDPPTQFMREFLVQKVGVSSNQIVWWWPEVVEKEVVAVKNAEARAKELEERKKEALDQLYHASRFILLALRPGDNDTLGHVMNANEHIKSALARFQV